MRKKYRWRESLKGQGYRLTTSREVVINALRNTDEHLSAEDIYMVAHKSHPAIGLTTIYRTLELLTQMGIIVKFDFGDGRSRYELSEDYGNKKHHHHLICIKCTKIFDYRDFVEDEIELINKTEKGLSAKYDFKITGHIITFFGLCTKCRKLKRY